MSTHVNVSRRRGKRRDNQKGMEELGEVADFIRQLSAATTNATSSGASGASGDGSSGSSGSSGFSSGIGSSGINGANGSISNDSPNCPTEDDWGSDPQGVQKLGSANADKKEIFPSLLRDGPGYSIGTAQHASGGCKPCAFYCFSNCGCRDAFACLFCHCSHESKLRLRREAWKKNNKTRMDARNDRKHREDDSSSVGCISEYAVSCESVGKGNTFASNFTTISVAEPVAVVHHELPPIPDKPESDGQVPKKKSSGKSHKDRTEGYGGNGSNSFDSYGIYGIYDGQGERQRTVFGHDQSKEVALASTPDNPIDVVPQVAYFDAESPVRIEPGAFLKSLAKANVASPTQTNPAFLPGVGNDLSGLRGQIPQMPEMPAELRSVLRSIDDHLIGFPIPLVPSTPTLAPTPDFIARAPTNAQPGFDIGNMTAAPTPPGLDLGQLAPNSPPPGLDLGPTDETEIISRAPNSTPPGLGLPDTVQPPLTHSAPLVVPEELLQGLATEPHADAAQSVPIDSIDMVAAQMQNELQSMWNRSMPPNYCFDPGNGELAQQTLELQALCRQTVNVLLTATRAQHGN